VIGGFINEWMIMRMEKALDANQIYYIGELFYYKKVQIIDSSLHTDEKGKGIL
jgi:hypothetical protein